MGQTHGYLDALVGGVAERGRQTRGGPGGSGTVDVPSGARRLGRGRTGHDRNERGATPCRGWRGLSLWLFDGARALPASASDATRPWNNRSGPGERQYLQCGRG